MLIKIHFQKWSKVTVEDIDYIQKFTWCFISCSLLYQELEGLC